MKTQLVDEQHRWIGDALLCARIATITTVEARGAPAMRFGIERADGHLYRVVETCSLIAAIHLCEVLRDMGCRPCDCPRVDGRPLHRAYRAPQDAARWPEHGMAHIAHRGARAGERRSTTHARP